MKITINELRQIIKEEVQNEISKATVVSKPTRNQVRKAWSEIASDLGDENVTKEDLADKLGMPVSFLTNELLNAAGFELDLSHVVPL